MLYCCVKLSFPTKWNQNCCVKGEKSYLMECCNTLSADKKHSIIYSISNGEKYLPSFITHKENKFGDIRITTVCGINWKVILHKLGKQLSHLFFNSFWNCNHDSAISVTPIYSYQYQLNILGQHQQGKLNKNVNQIGPWKICSSKFASSTLT